MAFLLYLLFLLPISVVVGEQYKILVLLPMAGKSHKNVFVPLMEGLAARGHDVTVVSPYKPTKPIPNLKEITIDANRQMMEASQKKMFQEIAAGGLMPGMGSFVEMTLTACKNYLNQSQTKQMLEEGKVFDLVIVQAVINECALVVGTMVGKTVIFLSPAIVPTTDNVLRIPPSVLPSIMSGFPSKMDFFQRMQNVVYEELTNFLFNYFAAPKLQALLSETIPTAPTLAEARQQVAFYLYNSDPVLLPPHPGAPNVVAVGAMHCKEAQALPKDVEDFIQSSGESGFIYFSLGSNAPSKYLPIQIREAFVSAFSRLKQKVIWKYEDDLPNKPDNVMTTKWAPQQDILGHSKIRLFITHGGMLSLQETLYHGVPVVGIPLFGDQPNNVVRVKELNIGEALPFKNITADLIFNTVTKILNNERYGINMKKYSAVLRDQPQKPLERAIFWTEYVIRHNGAPHLRPVGQDLGFIQHYLLDVTAFLLAVLVVTAFLLKKTVKVAYNYARRSRDAAGAVHRISICRTQE